MFSKIRYSQCVSKNQLERFFTNNAKVVFTVFATLKITCSAVFSNKQFVLVSKVEQLVVRMKKYKHCWNSFFIIWGVTV